MDTVMINTVFKIKSMFAYTREKGIKWVYNYIHFILFYDTTNYLLIKYLHWRHSYPSYLEVECTTRCPLKCKFCEHTFWNESSTDMTLDQFKHIIDQFPKLRWIGMTGIGEEFINKSFMNMLKYIKQKDISTFIELYDSFMFITEEEINELIDLGIERIFISLDAATKETYEKIRIGANWEKVMQNLETLVKLKKEKSAQFPQLCFHYIVLKDNIHEMVDFIDLVHSFSADVKLIQFSRMLHCFDEVKNLFVEVPEEITKEVNNKAKELGINVTWGLNVSQNKPSINRCMAWTMPFIFVNGDVIPCCAENEANMRNFQHKTSMGNIFKQSFKEIWNDARYNNLRRIIKQNKTPSACVNCPLFKTSITKYIKGERKCIS